jgi:type IX secretion system PorP/SprF family membrane protein
MRISLLCLVFTIGSLTLLNAQDQHFTQFFASPLTLNPALTGAFDGKYRVAFIYRDQEPFTTFSSAIDLRFGLSRKGKNYKDAFGVGVVFYNDKVAEVGYSNNNINITGAFHKSLSKRNDRFLSAGLQLGIAQRNFNYESFTFEDQFAGASGYSNPSSEILPANNYAYSDFGVGINYTYTPARKTAIFAGASIHHVLEPELSFYDDPDDPELSNSNTLFRKYSAYLNLSIPFGEGGVRFQPRALVYSQGPHLALNTGANLRILLDDITGTALHVGSWIRPVNNVTDELTLDALIGMVGLEYQSFMLGFSYDAQLEAIGAVRDRRGAFEISIAYLGEYEDETVLCPKF